MSGLFRNLSFSGFPVGTFIVNLLGSLMIGCFIALFPKDSHPLRFLLAVGFCGGFTTFSTFSSEIFLLLEKGSYGIVLAYIALSIIFGVAAFWSGYKIIGGFLLN